MWTSLCEYRWCYLTFEIQPNKDVNYYWGFYKYEYNREYLKVIKVIALYIEPWRLTVSLNLPQNVFSS